LTKQIEDRELLKKELQDFKTGKNPDLLGPRVASGIEDAKTNDVEKKPGIDWFEVSKYGLVAAIFLSFAKPYIPESLIPKLPFINNPIQNISKKHTSTPGNPPEPDKNPVIIAKVSRDQFTQTGLRTDQPSDRFLVSQILTVSGNEAIKIDRSNHYQAITANAANSNTISQKNLTIQYSNVEPSSVVSTPLAKVSEITKTNADLKIGKAENEVTSILVDREQNPKVTYKIDKPNTSEIKINGGYYLYGSKNEANLKLNQFIQNLNQNSPFSQKLVEIQREFDQDQDREKFVDSITELLHSQSYDFNNLETNFKDLETTANKITKRLEDRGGIICNQSSVFLAYYLELNSIPSALITLDVLEEVPQLDPKYLYAHTNSAHMVVAYSKDETNNTFRVVDPTAKDGPGKQKLRDANNALKNIEKSDSWLDLFKTNNALDFLKVGIPSAALGIIILRLILKKRRESKIVSNSESNLLENTQENTENTKLNKGQTQENSWFSNLALSIIKTSKRYQEPYKINHNLYQQNNQEMIDNYTQNLRNYTDQDQIKVEKILLSLTKDMDESQIKSFARKIKLNSHKIPLCFNSDQINMQKLEDFLGKLCLGLINRNSPNQ